MVRRGENIYKRKDGRWEGRYIKARQSNGKACYGYVYSRSYGEVKQLLLSKKRATLSEYVNTHRFYGTVSDWLEFWLEEVAKKDIKPSTYDSYKSKINCHLRPLLGNILLNDLDDSMIYEAILQMKAKLSNSSVHAVIRILKSALTFAKAKQYIDQTIFSTISLPNKKSSKSYVLSEKELYQLVQGAKKSKNLAVLLAIETGLRIGEIAGLKWQDIDFYRQILTVKRTLQRVKIHELKGSKTQLIEVSPKTKSSERTIPLSTNLLQLLLKEKVTNRSSYVIAIGSKCAEPRIIRYHFYRLLRQLQLPAITFHSLRHSFATRCINQGVSIPVVSTLLGHSSAKMTLDTYTRSTLQEEKKAIEKISLA